jgi:hypothetical protein
MAGVVVLFFGPALALRGVFFYGDVSNYALRLAYTGRWLRAGHFVLWNPLLSLGAPHAVDTGAQTFYPPNALLALLCGPWVYNYDVAFHVLLAATGTFALARALEMTRPAALLAAIAYAFGGFTFGHLQHLNVVVGLAWIPVAFAATERYLATSDRRCLGLAMLATGLLVLGGHPQIALYGLFALAAYCAFRLTILWHRQGVRRVLRPSAGLLAVAIGGLGLGMVFLLPFREWMEFVSRAERVTVEFATSYSLPPRRLFGLVAPFWFGGSLGRLWRPMDLLEWSSYLGLLPLGLAPVALARPNGKVLFFLALALVASSLALGAYGRLYGFLLSAPVFGSVRVPARFLVLTVLALALLAGFGLDALRTGFGRAWARVVAVGLLALALSVARAAWLRQRRGLFLPSRPDPVGFDQPDTLLLLATLVGTAGLLWLLARHGAESRLLVALAVSFAVADVFSYKGQLFFDDLAPPGAFEGPSANAEAIRSGGDTPRFYTWMTKEPSRLLDRGDLDAYRALMWEGLGNSLPMRLDLQSLTGYLVEPPVHALVVERLRKRGQFDTLSARLAGVFGVRYLVSGGVVSAPEMTAVTRGESALYRNEFAVPRAYLVPESRRAANDRAAFALVKHPDFDPRRTVVIEAEVPRMPDGPLGAARASIVQDEPDRVVVDTTSDRAVWLVLNDTFAPGWSATVDGRPATILRANGLVRTVALAAGPHRVAFAYAPATVKLGAGISLVALVSAGLLILVPRSRRGGP